MFVCVFVRQGMVLLARLSGWLCVCCVLCCVCMCVCVLCVYVCVCVLVLDSRC